MPGSRARNLDTAAWQERQLMDVLLFQMCGSWQTFFCYSVTLLLGFMQQKLQQLPEQRKC